MTVTLDDEVFSLDVTGEKWFARITKPFGFAIDGVRGVVPVGFLTDFASTPFHIRSRAPQLKRPSVIHDLYCQHLGTPTDCPPLGWWGTNEMFREAMFTCGAPFIERWNDWLWVSGWTAFHWDADIQRIRGAELHKLHLASLMA